jgi:hypothetical protein
LFLLLSDSRYFFRSYHGFGEKPKPQLRKLHSLYKILPGQLLDAPGEFELEKRRENL